MSITPKTCGHCNTKNPAAMSFCGGCGRPLREIDDCELLNFGECPNCGSFGTLKCQGTPRPIRHLKCCSCEKNYQTIEVFLIHKNALALAEPLVTRRLY
jgi:hypothetical protein